MSRLVIGLASLLLATACADHTTVITVGQGTLIVDWTIDDSKDPGQCRQGGTTTIDVTVRSSSGRSRGYQASCEAFATSIDLPADSYDATAVLIDDAGNDRTTPVDINPFRIRAGEVLTVPIDFPAGSFLVPL
jgi:hypothetical protein